jgi:DNA-binding NarL/FixJ family response regulator
MTTALSASDGTILICQETVMQIETRGTAALTDIHFSPREKDVLPLLLQGYSSKEIARALSISPRTVDIYRSAILGKVRVRKTTQLHAALRKMNLLLSGGQADAVMA